MKFLTPKKTAGANIRASDSACQTNFD